MNLVFRRFSLPGRLTWTIIVVTSFLFLPSDARHRAWAESIQLGDLTIVPGFGSRGFPTVFDLTSEDVVLSYTIDLSRVTKNSGQFGPFIEIGLREQGADNLNPGVFGVHPGGSGGWMISAVGDITGDESAFDWDDKHNLQSAGDLDESEYDAVGPSSVVTPFGSLDKNRGILFDRDGVGIGQDATHANTHGSYEIEIRYHAMDAKHGTMFAQVNGIPQSFHSDASPVDGPAGLSFAGDMTQMQVFLGTLMADGMGTIRISDLTAATLGVVPEPAGWWLSLLGLYWFHRQCRKSKAKVTRASDAS